MVNAYIAPYVKMIEMMDRKLQDLMPDRKYHEFMREVGKAAFRVSVDTLPDGDFQDFCNENFDRITDEVDQEES